jgi:hypothetical protein
MRKYNDHAYKLAHPPCKYNKLCDIGKCRDTSQIICGLAYVAAQAVVHLIVTLHMVC